MSLEATTAGGEAAAPTTPGGDYVGFATRTVAFVVDGALINLVALIVGGAVSLAVAVFHLPKGIRAVLVVIGGIAYILWSAGYFAAFWSATGQTPGARMMQFRVVSVGRKTIGLKRGIVRVVGMVLAALPLFLGYVLVLFDGRRRGFHDRFAGTVVIEATQRSVAAEQRDRMRGPPAVAGRSPAVTDRAVPPRGRGAPPPTETPLRAFDTRRGPGS